MATYALADGNSAVISDEDGIHSGGTFTIPAAWNGRRVRMQFQTLSEISGATLYQSLRNGASHDGAAAQHAEGANNPAGWIARHRSDLAGLFVAIVKSVSHGVLRIGCELDQT